MVLTEADRNLTALASALMVEVPEHRVRSPPSNGTECTLSSLFAANSFEFHSPVAEGLRSAFLSPVSLLFSG